MADVHPRVIDAFEALLEHLHLHDPELLDEFSARKIRAMLDPPATTTSADDGATWHLDSTFRFGKHYGSSVQEVLDSNPGYLVWATENVDNFILPRDVLEAAIAGKEEEDDRFRRSRSGGRKPPTSTFGSNTWGSPDYDDDIPF